MFWPAWRRCRTSFCGRKWNRLRIARAELEARDHFAHVIVNDDVHRAAAELTTLIRRAPGA